MADEVVSKIGLYICSGCDIEKAVDTQKLAEFVEEEGGTEVCKVHEFFCSDDAVNMIKEDIASQGLNKIVVAACSNRFNSDVF
ncbi:MAG: heterodisulfide reductase subunit A, partial [Planctomycetota bacterium]